MAENKKKKGFSLADELAKVADVSMVDTEGREKLEYIDIGNIHADPNNFYSLDGIDNLAANIELVGLQQPLRVRPDPNREGHFIIVSGHRRHTALWMLVGEGKDKFREVPCIVEAGVRKESAAMAELRLIYANSSTREMTGADKARQAERVEVLLYQLKEEGVEFPGRMRDHVAEACKVSASKLARLKVIREKLKEPLFVNRWNEGALEDTAAYALARLPAILQTMIADEINIHGRPMPSAWRLEKLASRDDLDRFTTGCDSCPEGEGCTGAKNQLRQSLFSGDCTACYGHTWCCMECIYLGYCEYPCEHGAAKKKADKAEARKRRAQERADEKSRLQRYDAHVRSVLEPFAQRIAGLCGDEDTLRSVIQECGETSGKEWGLGLVFALKGHAFSDKPAQPLDAMDITATQLALLCRQLSVSADYLLGLADDPLTQMVEGGKPKGDNDEEVEEDDT